MKRRDEVLVGLFTIVALVVLAVGSLWLARGGLSPGYPLYARFPWGAGVKEGQPVWLVGVTIGYVDGVTLDPQGSVVINMRINEKYKVPRGTTAALMANGFFGDQAVGLQPKGPNPLSYAAGDTLPVRPAEAGLSQIASRADTISAGLAGIISSIRGQFIDSGGVRDLRRTISSLNKLIVQLDNVAAVQSKALESTIATARSKVAAIDTAQVDSTVRSVRQAAQNLSAATAQLETTTHRINNLLALADSGNGSLAKLLRDPAIHDSLTTLLGSMHGLLEDLKKNPRRYINLRIF